MAVGGNLDAVSPKKTECPICSTLFFKRNGGQRYCCRECRQLARTIVPMHRFCRQCGTKFTPSRDSDPQQYCSPACVGLSRRGENHPLWKGGRSKTPAGYIRVWTDEGYRMEHHLVMEEHLGRRLLPHEEVHHKHGVRDDNRIEHLELWSVSQPHGQRVEDKVAWAREILALYATMP